MVTRLEDSIGFGWLVAAADPKRASSNTLEHKDADFRDARRESMSVTCRRYPIDSSPDFVPGGCDVGLRRRWCIRIDLGTPIIFYSTEDEQNRRITGT